MILHAYLFTMIQEWKEQSGVDYTTSFQKMHFLCSFLTGTLNSPNSNTVYSFETSPSVISGGLITLSSTLLNNLFKFQHPSLTIYNIFITQITRNQKTFYRTIKGACVYYVLYFRSLLKILNVLIRSEKELLSLIKSSDQPQHETTINKSVCFAVFQLKNWVSVFNYTYLEVR